jgi:peptide/nickel transport system substrate-binding protein
MDTVEATDDNTVVFHLKAPNAYLFTGTQLGEIANMGIVPAEILADLDNATPVGSGPYQQVTGEVGVRFHYERFANFRNADSTYIDRREFTLFGDRVAEEAAFTAGQTDHHLPTASSPSVDQLRSQLGDKIYTIPYPTTAPYTVNIGGSKAFNLLKRDDRARQAVYRSLDRQQFIDLLFSGKATLPPAMLTEALADYQLDAAETEETFRRDPAEARKLFEAAGALGQEWEIMYFAPSAENEQACQIFQNQLRDSGLETFIAGIPSSEGFAKATAGEWHLFAGGHPAYSSPQIIMRQQHSVSGSRFGYTGLEDAEIDALVEQSEQATDYEENVRLVKEVQRASLAKWTGYILLASRTIELLLYNHVKDWDVDPGETYFPRTNAWLDI